MSKELKDLPAELQKHLDDYIIGFFVEEKPHKDASASLGLKTFAGGSARKSGASISKKTITQMANEFEEKYGVFSRPYTKEDPQLQVCFLFAISDFFKEGDSKNRIKNTALAMVRNPILRQEFGHNSPETIKIKGFDRLMIDTGQFFNAIKAEVVSQSETSDV